MTNSPNGRTTSRIPRLYKYRSLAGESGKRTEDIIRNSRLWYSKASAFNDPFDCNLMIAGKAEGEWEEMFGSFVGRVGQDFRLGTASLIRQAGGKVPRLLQPKKTEKRRWQIRITDKEGRAREVLCQVGQVGIRRRMARTERRAGFRAVHETGPEGYHRRLREHRGESRVGAKDGRGPASEGQALQGGQEET
jgi:hypothetical protein